MASERALHKGPRVQKATPDKSAEEQPVVTHEPHIAGSDASDEHQTLLDQLIPQLALAAVCFAAGGMVGYQYGVNCQCEQPRLAASDSRSAEEEDAMPDTDRVDNRDSAAKELRTSGAAAAGAIQREAESHSQGRLYASADAAPGATPDSRASNATQLPAPNTALGPAGQGEPIERSSEGVGASGQQDAKEELPFVHVLTPRGEGSDEEPTGASPCTPASSSPGSVADGAGSSDAGTTAEAASRRDPDRGAGKCFGSPLEERVAGSAECSSSGRGTVGFVQSMNETPGLQRLRWAMGGDGGQWPQLDHWDEATAFWAAFSRQLNVRHPLDPVALCLTSQAQPIWASIE